MLCFGGESYVFTSGLRSAPLVNIPFRQNPRDGGGVVLAFCKKVDVLVIMADRGQKDMVTYEIEVSEFSYEVKYDLQGRHGLVGDMYVMEVNRS